MEITSLSDMNRRFDEKLNELASQKGPNTQFFTSESYTEMIEKVKSSKAKVSNKKPDDYQRLKRFDVITVGFSDCLVVPVKEDNIVRYYVKNNDIFQILHDTHLTIGHGGRNRMAKELHSRYKNITREMIGIYLNLCDICERKRNDLQLSGVEGPSKPKKKEKVVVKSETFAIVKRCCIALVKEHGHAITMFDEKAFKVLIDLLPLTSSQKNSINSENIQRMLDGGEDDADDDNEYEVAVDSREQEDDDDVPTPMKIKKEKVQCTCQARHDPDESTHADNCPKYSEPAYWTYFAVSVDEATCSICKDVISWTDISTLKDHLTNKHPDVKFIDDDDTFQRGPPSSPGGSREDMEEVYLPDEDYMQTSRESEPRRKRPRTSMPNVNMSRDELAASLQDRFRSLDCFGQYVASLMKLLPKDKCVKFQIQIVERLLREQAAAG